MTINFYHIATQQTYTVASSHDVTTIMLNNVTIAEYDGRYSELLVNTLIDIWYNACLQQVAIKEIKQCEIYSW